jgi:hypothetical protein
VDGGQRRRMAVGPVGYNFVSAAPDGRTALVIHNGNAEDQVQQYMIQAADLERMETGRTQLIDAPVNNILYRSGSDAVISLGREITAFDPQTLEVGEQLAPRMNHPYLLAAFPGDAQLVYAVYVASKVVIKTVDTAQRKVVAQHELEWGWTASTNVEPFGDDHLIFPPGSSAGAICLWNRHSAHIEFQAGLPANLVLASPHPDGRHFYLYDHLDQTLKVVEAAKVMGPRRNP